ncbi:hypothetical protein BMETH_2301144426172, partial [methanotrophic bacterial endosymbiont of Bathymodiolus sp.]
AEVDIVDGPEPARFDPMLVRTLESVSGTLEGKSELSAFQDVSEVHAWAVSAIGIVLERVWMQGKAAGKLESTATATRAESAKMLVNVLGPVFR